MTVFPDRDHRSEHRATYEQLELRDWIASVVGENPVAAAPGVFYVVRDQGRRTSFAASLFRRAAAIPRRLDLTPEMREVLLPLERFIAARGRCPVPEERGDWSAIVARFGTIGRALRQLERVGDGIGWKQMRAARSEDLLVYLGCKYAFRR